MKRFYKQVAVGEDFAVLLDGKPIKTPANARLALPTSQLAEAVAREWRMQAATIDPASMMLTKLSNTAIDRAETLRDDMAAELLGFGRSDLLCYRATAPVDLLARQEAGWNPLLDWAHHVHGARLKTAQGITYIQQDQDAVAALERTLRARDSWTLTGLQTATTITGSLVLALAMAQGRLTPAEAFALSRIDEAYQTEKWGTDTAAEKRAGLHAAELEMAGKFMELARA